MSQADREARLLAAVYRTYGVAALWVPADGGPSVPVTVRLGVDDETIRLGESRALNRRTIMFVRVAEMPAPTNESTVQTGSRTYSVLNTPVLDEGGLEWRFGVAE